MAEIVLASKSSPQEETRSYILDMVAQLGHMARESGDIRLAALLERVLAAAMRSEREH